MPQLDAVSYFNQFLWLVLFFFLIFLLHICYMLPNLFKVFLFSNKIGDWVYLRSFIWECVCNNIRIVSMFKTSSHYNIVVYSDLFSYRISLWFRNFFQFMLLLCPGFAVIYNENSDYPFFLYQNLICARVGIRLLMVRNLYLFNYRLLLGLL